MAHKKPKDRVTAALLAVGISPQQFAPDKLKISYQMFRYRVRKNILKLDDYHKIMHYTGQSFDALWPSPFVVIHEPIKMNLTPSTASRVPPKVSQEPIQPSASLPSLGVEEKPERRKRIVDIYDGGLPPSEEGNSF